MIVPGQNTQSRPPRVSRPRPPRRSRPTASRDRVKNQDHFTYGQISRNRPPSYPLCVQSRLSGGALRASIVALDDTVCSEEIPFFSKSRERPSGGHAFAAGQRSLQPSMPLMRAMGRKRASAAQATAWRAPGSASVRSCRAHGARNAERQAFLLHLGRGANHVETPPAALRASWTTPPLRIDRHQFPGT